MVVNPGGLRSHPEKLVFKGDYLMKRTTLIVAAAVLSATALINLSGTAFAWHPEGKIVKKVQNITTGSVLSDADTTETGVAAKPGDQLKYVVEVRNIAPAAQKQYNDMVNTVVTDELPAGVELVSNPSQRKLTADLGRIVPGETKKQEYVVRVTAKIAAPVTNTACFTGNTEVNDNAQKGCNPAVVNVTIPPTPEVPVVTTPTPKSPVVEMPAELPKTGLAENVFAATLAIGALLYATSRYVISKRDLSKTIS